MEEGEEGQGGTGEAVCWEESKRKKAEKLVVKENLGQNRRED